MKMKMKIKTPRKENTTKTLKSKNSRKVFLRKRVKNPFPTNYLPKNSLKISAILRYYEFKSIIKKTERGQRKERDIETSKYSILVSYLEEEIEKQRESLIKRQEESTILVFKIHPKFDGILGKCVRYLSFQDNVKVIALNKNYSKIGNEPSRLLYVRLRIN